MKFITREPFLLLQTYLILVFFKVALKFVSYDKIYSTIKVLYGKPVNSYKKHATYVGKLIWAVTRLKKLTKTNCLEQALTVHVLLNSKSIDNTLHIGFIKGKGGFSAHAWIQAENKVLIGGGATLSLYFKI